MSTSKQVLYISILFLGLMLLSAGVGALLAGEMGFGLLFLAGGLFLTGIDGTILYLLWKKSRSQE